MHLLFILLFLFTKYENQTYSTQCAVDVNAPAEISDTILARFIYDFQHDPDALFDWAFYGVGAQSNQEKNVFLLEYKETQYIPEKNYGKVVVDVVVPHFTRINGITIEADVMDEKHPITHNNNLSADMVRIEHIPLWMRHMFITVRYSGNLIKAGYGNLYIIPVDSLHSIFFMDINIKYGWFFNLFINMKGYKNSVEWRVNSYMNNLKKVAESTQNNGSL